VVYGLIGLKEFLFVWLNFVIVFLWFKLMISEDFI
jgi:hypothetical protein